MQPSGSQPVAQPTRAPTLNPTMELPAIRFSTIVIPVAIVGGVACFLLAMAVRRRRDEARAGVPRYSVESDAGSAAQPMFARAINEHLTTAITAPIPVARVVST